MKKRLMIVDDEKGFTSMLSLNLEATGQYEVRVVNNPKDAQPMALQYHPDLILLDVIMPQMEGPDVANEIRSNPNIKNTPIIFLTATVTNDEVAAQGGHIGGHRFVSKPSQLPTLLDTIEKSLSHRI